MDGAILDDVAECGKYDGGAKDDCEWGVWGVERGLERVSAATAVTPYPTAREGTGTGTGDVVELDLWADIFMSVRLHRGHEEIYIS